MSREPSHHRRAARPPILLRMQDRETVPAPSPTAHRAPHVSKSPNTRRLQCLQNGKLASAQLIDELNATIPPTPAPLTPGGPTRPPRTTLSSAPTTQGSYPGPRPINPLGFDNGTAQDPRPMPGAIRLPGLGNATVPAAKDSYPGPFKRLAEYTDKESRPGFQFRRESHGKQPDENAAHERLPFGTSPIDGDRIRRSPSQTRRSPSQARSQTPALRATTSAFGNLDVDVDMEDDYLFDGEIEANQNAELEMYISENKSLVNAAKQHILDVLVMRADYAEQLEVADIEVETLQERLQESEDRRAELQQQLEDSGTHAQTEKDGDTFVFAENNDNYLAQIDTLQEKLIEAREKLHEKEWEIEDANRKVTSLKGKRRAGSRSNGEEASAGDAYLIQTLLENEQQLKEQIDVLQAQQSKGSPGCSKQQNDFQAHEDRLAAELQQKAARLDALWDTLRNFQDMEDKAQNESALQARVTYLETFVRRARAQINGAEDVDDIEKHDGCQGEIARLQAEIYDISFQMHDARERAISAEGLAEFWKNGGPDLSNRRGESAEDREEIAQNKTYVAHLTDMVNGLNRQLDKSKLDNERLGKTVRIMKDGTEAAEKAAVIKQLEEDVATMDGHLEFQNEKTVELFHKVHEKGAENRKLQQELAKAQKQGAINEKALSALQTVFADLQETVPLMEAEQEEVEAEVKSLRSELKELRGAQGIAEDPYDDSGYAEHNTPLESDELPLAKRARRSASDVEDESDGEEEEEEEEEEEVVDEVIFISSDSDSEEGQLTPELEQDDEDEDEMEFQREFENASPADPRGGIVVIDRYEAPESRSSKRKRYL